LLIAFPPAFFLFLLSFTSFHLPVLSFALGSLYLSRTSFLISQYSPSRFSYQQTTPIKYVLDMPARQEEEGHRQIDKDKRPRTL
jgi:hypothetical protein